MAYGKISDQFSLLAEQAGIPKKVFDEMMQLMVSQSDAVVRFTFSSFLPQTTQRQYWQSYQGRLKQLEKKQEKITL